jgi:hypothetical protein
MITQYLKWDQVLEVTVFMSIGFGEHLRKSQRKAKGYESVGELLASTLHYKCSFRLIGAFSIV